MARTPDNKSIADLKKDLEEMKKLGVDKKLIDKVEKIIAEQEKAEEKKVAAIVKSVTTKKKETPKQENIDQRLLELLGLEDYEAELDYDQYITLIKEKLAASRMVDAGKVSQEGDQELLIKELRRAQKSSGSFKVKNTRPKKKTVTASGFVGKKNTTTPSSKPKRVQTNKLLPGGQANTPEEIKTELQEDTQEKLVPLSKSLTEIEKNLQDILDLNKKKLELDKQAARDAAKREETEGFDKSEAKLEESDKGKKGKETITKILKPASDIFDMILNFFKNVLLGGAIQLILDIIKNPKKYLQGLIDFGNYLITILDNTLEFIVDGLFKPINFIIDGINEGIKILENSINKIANLPLIDFDPIDIPSIPNIDIEVPDLPKIPDVLQKQSEGGEVININNLSLLDGGAIDKMTGLKIGGMGKDTQLIAAAPGEIMMSKKAVDAYGAETLLGMNAAAGGNNTPKFGKIGGYYGGGMIGQQGSAPIRDFGMGGGAGSKGYIVVPGHAAGAGAPGEMQLVRDLARRTVENLKEKFGSDIPVRLMDMHDETPNTDEGFRIQQDKLKALENQGYEVIEVHMDASIESGYGTGRGVIPPMPGTDEINPVEADFAKTYGAFSRTHRGGLAATNRGVSIIELGNMSPELQDMVLRGSGLNNNQLDILTRPLEESLTRGLKLQSGVSQVSPMDAGAQIKRQKIEVKIDPPVVSPAGGNTTVLPVPTQPKSPTSAASAAQGRVPSFNAEDGSNFDLVVVKSIYNIVG